MASSVVSNCSDHRDSADWELRSIHALCPPMVQFYNISLLEQLASRARSTAASMTASSLLSRATVLMVSGFANCGVEQTSHEKHEQLVRPESMARQNRAMAATYAIVRPKGHHHLHHHHNHHHHHPHCDRHSHHHHDHHHRPQHHHHCDRPQHHSPQRLVYCSSNAY